MIAFDDAITAAELGRRMRDQYETDGARAWIQLDDARVARLDATTLAVAIDETPPDDGRLSMSAPNHVDTASEVDLGGTRWTTGTGARAAILRRDGAKAAPRPTFLQPAFVLVDNEPLAIEGDPVIVGGGLELIAREGNLLVVTGTTRGRAIAIDPATGAVRWRFDQ